MGEVVVNSSQTSKAVSWSAKKGMEETVVMEEEEEAPVEGKEVLLAAQEEEAGPEGEGDEKEEEEQEVEESMPGTEVAEVETRRASDEPMEGKVGLRSFRN